MNLSKRSLFILLGIIIISVVTTIMSVHSSHIYLETKEKIIDEMKYDANYLGFLLQKNLSDLITSYAINEYDKLIYNAISHRDNFAIVIEDYNMGKIMGKKFYVSGKIRDTDWNIIDYDPENRQHQQQLKHSFYSDRYDVTTVSGDKIGTISIYLSNRSINKELNKIIINTIHSTLLISLILIFSLFLIIRLFILKPLTNVIDTLSTTDADGLPLDIIPNDGSFEIFTLANVMNKMINSIKTSNITLKKQHHKLLSQQTSLNFQASHDQLTGLANRYRFDDRLQQSIEKSKRNNTKIALLFIDLDYFKEINDSYGHKTGDEILKLVAQRLNKTIRQEDTLARLGGDEFTVIIEDFIHAQDVSLLANKILTILAEPIKLKDNTFYVGCSIGISFYPDNGDVSEDLLKNADAAMFKAKEQGRNNYQFYNTEMTELALERIVMEANIRAALINQEFIVYYQPQTNGKTNQLIGMEALVRWQSPSMGLVSPAKFIPLAESTGLIVELDRFVMKSAMTQIAQWYKAGHNPGRLAMNLAVKQLQQKDFIDFFSNLIKETGCNTLWLELEVTEGQIMANPEEAIKVLNQISKLGINLAIDDFGTGYSSLSYLKKLPINKLKIDQSFVRDLPDDDEDTAITKAVIALAKNLNLGIIAEGVETKEQKDFLLKNGCHHIQGYLYSKPLNVNEMEIYLKKNKE
jgi:diguanylate cyclase (GGDEF)-like protein